MKINNFKNLKMSKINSNYIQSKIASIARNSIKYKKEESIRDNIENVSINKNYVNKEESNNNNNDNNKLELSTTTLRDSLSYLEEFKDSFYKTNHTKKLNILTNKTMNCNKRFSSICTKGTITSSDINRNLNLTYNNDTYLKPQNEEKKIINVLLERINFDEIKEIKKIYEQLKYIFNDTHNVDNVDNLGVNKKKILSYDFIKILFSQNIEYLIKVFYYSIEVNKFFLFQIYLFLRLIYLDEKKINEYILLSYKTIIIYSSQNFENILSIIESKFSNNEMINKNVFNINKIIISILKTLTFIPSKNQIIYYITPTKNIIDINLHNMEIEEIIKNRISGLNKLIMLLKENKVLQEQLSQIEKMKEINEKNNKNNTNNTIEEEEIITNILEEGIENKILPDFEINKYKYSVIIELDETLVHYCEEGDKYFVKVRYGCEIFLQYIHDFCEIIIVSTSGIEYSDIIINNLNSNVCLINHKIYTENYHDLNLSLINRDMNKTFFICHQDNFFNAPKSNIIKLKEFDGDEKDKEFVKLHTEFKNIEKKEINDVRNIINNIRNNIMKEIIE